MLQQSHAGFFRGLFGAVAIGALAIAAVAQVSTTGLHGIVRDPSGAVVPNVAVSITNIDTGWNRLFPTNDAGQYVAVDLQIGHYDIKATAAGFKAAEQKSVVLTVGDRVRVGEPLRVCPRHDHGAGADREGPA